MALINCPECNKEVSDKAEVCPNCGFGVARYVKRQNKIEKIQEEAEKEAYLYVKQKKKEEKEKEEREKRAEEDRKNSIYNEAVSKYGSNSSKDVEKARELFLSVSGWKDSDKYLEQCKKRIFEIKQQEKIQDKNNKIKILIISIFSLMFLGILVGGYSFYIKKVFPSKIYESAMLNIQMGNYDEAIKQLETINTYEDASEQIKIASEMIVDSKYLEAKELVDNQEYTEALEILEQIENERNVDELRNKCENAIALINIYGKEYQKICYKRGMDAYKALDYKIAAKFFNMIPDYKDSEEMLLKIENAYSQQEYISDEDRKLLQGCWYKAKEDDIGGRVIVIDASGQSRKIQTGWDHSYTLEYVKENYKEFEERVRFEDDCMVNNGDGTYSMLSLDGDGNEIRLFTFKISDDALEIISVFYNKTWKSEIGIYNRVR